MKKGLLILAHLVLFATIFTVAGLQKVQTETEVEKFTGQIERGAVIRILDNDTAVKQGYLKHILAAFNEKYKAYNVEARDANMDQYSDLEKDGPYGFGPDVLYQANDRLMSYVDGKHILYLPKESLSDTDKISDQAWNAFEVEAPAETMTFAAPVNVQGALLYYRKDLIPSDYKLNYDINNNDVPDMLESWNAMYKFSLERKAAGKWGYMRSYKEPYFSIGYLLSYGAYIFGDDNTNPKDIGLSKNNAATGASVLRQLATLMDERAIDDTITVTAYSQLAKGNFFATITTPDVYTLFIDQMIAEGMSRAEAIENLGVADIPKLPKSGDLTTEITDFENQLMPNIMMGGVHGYAISSYSKYPNAALEFIKFATNYENILLRNEMLGIAPARTDIATEVGGLSSVINMNLNNKTIAVMPSIRETGQIWTPLATFFQDVAKDPFRSGTEKSKYNGLADFQVALERVDKQIYDAIHTLG